MLSRLISLQVKIGHLIIYIVEFLVKGSWLFGKFAGIAVGKLFFMIFHWRRSTKPVIKVPHPKIRFGFSKLGCFLLGIIFAFGFCFAPYKVYVWFRELPKPDLLIELGNNKSTKILDRNGLLLYEIYIDRKYDPVALEKIPEHMVLATLAIEDDAFYTHKGFRAASLLRAAKATVFEDNLQGGSTITQQLVKNVFLTPQRTISRKLKELVLALLVEHKYSKDEILEFYLNNIPYGGTVWGIEPAAQKFFGKHIWDVNLAEASFLAGLPTAPSAYSPFLNDPEISKSRQIQVLSRMVGLNYITAQEAKEAEAYPLQFISQSEYIRAPHFVSYVRSLLEEKYGKRYVAFGGLTIKTTLDLSLQEKVEDIVSEEVQKNKNLNISNGSAIVLNSKTGEILAYVGSVDYFRESWGAFDVIAAFRQPGSSIKPVTYALAFEKGYTPATIIDDKAVTYTTIGEVYQPVNYDNKFHGKVTLRQALANSYNIPAVKLVNMLGLDNMVTLGKKLGLKGWEVDGSYGLSVTLGGKEVRLLDLANVYATFARAGIYKEVLPFMSVTDSAGYAVYKVTSSAEQQVVSMETAYLLSHILSDNGARTSAFGANSALVIPGYTVAVKTGTTDSKRDNWTFGYTLSFTVGVWVGNNDNSPMSQTLTSGLSGAAPIWNRIMTAVLTGTPKEEFLRPKGIFTFVDKDCDNRSEIFARGSNIPKHLCEVAEQKESED